MISETVKKKDGFKESFVVNIILISQRSTLIFAMSEKICEFNRRK